MQRSQLIAALQPNHNHKLQANFVIGILKLKTLNDFAEVNK